MSELDDLLGDGPSPTKAPTTAAEPPSVLEDLLGEAMDHAGSNATAPSLAAADDLLGGTGHSTSTSTVHHSHPTKSSVPPRPARRNQLQAPITLPVVGDVSPALSSFKTPSTYFLRFVHVYEEPQTDRKRRVVIIDDKHLKVKSKEGDTLREVPLGSIVALVRQSVFTSKAFGFGKDYELHVLLQLEDDKDLYLALGADNDNGLASTSDIERVLAAVTNAYGVVLTVSDLREQESIEQMVKWVKADDTLRRQYTDALASRTEVLAELQQLTKMDNQLAHSIEALKASTAAQASMGVLKDIDRMQQALNDMTAKGQSIERSKVETEKILKALQLDINKEEARRAATVRESMAAEAQEALHRQVSEYEIMRAAHKREMDTTAAIIQIQEQRLASRTKASFATSSDMMARLIVLDDEEAMINEKRLAKAQHRVAINAALVEAKKRLVLAKATLATLTDQVEQLGVLPSNAQLPPTISTEPAPIFQQVDVPPYTDGDQFAAPSASPPPPPAAPPAKAAVAKKAVSIDLDDDDDVDVVVPPVAPPPPAAAPKPVVLDDDDI